MATMKEIQKALDILTQLQFEYGDIKLSQAIYMLEKIKDA